MRCFFLRDGHIAGVEMLTGLSDKDAIAKAHSLFSERGTRFDGFEVWDRARVVVRHPKTDACASPPISKAIPGRLIRRADKVGSFQAGSPSLPESPSKRRVTAERRLPHDDEARSLQVLDDPLGGDLRHDFVGVMDALAALIAQGRNGRPRGHSGDSGARGLARWPPSR